MRGPTSGRPGPVVVALPEDMLTDRVVVADAPPFEPVETWPGLSDMARLQKLLWGAERPIMLLGRLNQTVTFETESIFAVWIQWRYQQLGVKPVAFEVTAVAGLTLFYLVLAGTQQIAVIQRIHCRVTLRLEVFYVGIALV